MTRVAARPDELPRRGKNSARGENLRWKSCRSELAVRLFWLFLNYAGVLENELCNVFLLTGVKIVNEFIYIIAVGLLDAAEFQMYCSTV